MDFNLGKYFPDLAKKFGKINNCYEKLVKELYGPVEINSPVIGGFTNQDWQNIGNDLRRSILSYEKEK
ncbi:hypothetical protein PT285_07125 [Lactobacillus sp. ESL0791]|uniref:hypothetical protein n=1 Tax=Lactobacillus sp. ESL0791 TaxID=2983234 RepID=UPI0023F84E03|nr:hypothetical protein [Lactobacillus sp. ESL0791]MDF7639171.1 hypothetical protein [Lactobacillus sp. ESL0791]